MRIAFVDVDYMRGTRRHGPRRTLSNAPETWLVERCGIVWGLVRQRPTGEIMVDFVDDALIAGPRPVTTTLKELRSADLIVGHGLLVNDYRAFHTTAPVPDAILSATADTLLAFTNARSRTVNSPYPTGLHLTDLVDRNLSRGSISGRGPGAQNTCC